MVKIVKPSPPEEAIDAAAIKPDHSAVPRWFKIYLVVTGLIAAAAVAFCLLHGKTEDENAGDDVAWQEQLTEGAKSYYGPNWKPTKKEQRELAAGSREAAKAYGPPKTDGDQDQ